MPTVTFINIPTRKDAVLSVYPPVGILSMAACLKERGYSASFIDADVLQLGPDDVAQLTTKEPPRIVGISLTVGQVAHAEHYIAAIQRMLPAVSVAVGGPYVSGVGKNIFHDFPTIDYAVVKEGERAIVDLVEHLEGKKDLGAVRNLLYRQDGVVCQNAVERILDIEALPLPDYSLISDFFDKYKAPDPSIASPSMLIMCTRGCPYECTFCSSPTTWERRVTFRSTDSVIKEIIHLRKIFNVREIFFQDDTLNARPAWFIELCEKLIDHGLHNGIYYKCPFRVDQMLLTAELLKKAKQAHFWMIFYGVESGNEDMLRSMKKKVTVDEIRRAFRLTREAGIFSYASFMIGNNGETEATVHDSLSLLDDIRPDFGGFAVAIPFPGSELYDTALRKGFITQSDFKKYQFGDCNLRTAGLTTSEIVALQQRVSTHFNELKNKLWAQQKLDIDTLAVTLAVAACPATIYPSQTVPIQVSVTNQSKEWFSSIPPFPVNFAYHWKDNHDTYTVYDGRRTGLNVPLMPSEERTVILEVDSPEEPGIYTLEIDLVQESHFWFEQQLDNLPVRLGLTVVEEH